MATIHRPLLKSRSLCIQYRTCTSFNARFSSSVSTNTEAPTATNTESTIDPLRPAPTEPYFVGRTKSNNLPVYTQAKRGGNLQQTKIQKVEGNTSVLRKQLQSALSLGEKEVVVNPVTSHIIIKGWRQQDVVEFLEKRNF